MSVAVGVRVTTYRSYDAAMRRGPADCRIDGSRSYVADRSRKPGEQGQRGERSGDLPRDRMCTPPGPGESRTNAEDERTEGGDLQQPVETTVVEGERERVHRR